MAPTLSKYISITIEVAVAVCLKKKWCLGNRKS